MRKLVVVSAALLSVFACNRTPDVRGRYVWRSKDDMVYLVLGDSGRGYFGDVSKVDTVPYAISANGDTVIVSTTAELHGTLNLSFLISKDSLVSVELERTFVKQHDAR